MKKILAFCFAALISTFSLAEGNTSLLDYVREASKSAGYNLFWEAERDYGFFSYDKPVPKNAEGLLAVADSLFTVVDVRTNGEVKFFACLFQGGRAIVVRDNQKRPCGDGVLHTSLHPEVTK